MKAAEWWPSQRWAWAARMACADRTPLGRLQHDMAADWTALYRVAGGEPVLSLYQPGG